MISIFIWALLAVVIFIVGSGLFVVRPIERGLIETFGKYTRLASPGLGFIIPFIQQIIRVNITERMSHIQPQEIITKDNLNAQVDLVVYFKIKADEQSIKNSVYNVNEVKDQLDTLARTTARNVIGGMPFREVNSERQVLNNKLQIILAKETKDWGVEVLKVELKDITPPADVQETMNRVIKAENEKDAAIDFATAQETQADGLKRAAIKEAEGIAKGRLIVAEANAKKIKIENTAARTYFTGNAQKLKQLEVADSALKNNAKVILGADAKGILKLFDLNK